MTKEQKFLMEEHQKRMEAGAQRIANVGSAAERKKNKFDPISHPVYLFRKDNNVKDVN